jgi:hypothetical protein
MRRHTADSRNLAHMARETAGTHYALVPLEV